MLFIKELVLNTCYWFHIITNKHNWVHVIFGLAPRSSAQDTQLCRQSIHFPWHISCTVSNRDTLYFTGSILQFCWAVGKKQSTFSLRCCSLINANKQQESIFPTQAHNITSYVVWYYSTLLHSYNFFRKQQRVRTNFQLHKGTGQDRTVTGALCCYANIYCGKKVSDSQVFFVILNFIRILGFCNVEFMGTLHSITIHCNPWVDAYFLVHNDAE